MGFRIAPLLSAGLGGLGLRRDGCGRDIRFHVVHRHASRHRGVVDAEEFVYA